MDEMKKKGLEFSFAWLFATIVGAAILFIAIYAVVDVIDRGEQRANAELTSEIGILLNPIEIGLEDGKSFEIGFPQETRVFNSCRDVGNFGQQIISASYKTNFKNDFGNPEVEKIFYDRYLFSDRFEQGSNLHIFVKPLEMPFKVGSLIYVYSEDYCFINPPSEIENEITDLDIKGIMFSSSLSECSRDSIKVCFSGNIFTSGCDINVDTGSETVTHRAGEGVGYYGNSLLYGAIFAEPEIYECQLKRLMKRAGELAQLYASKSALGSGCGESLANDLKNYASESQIENSGEIDQITFKSENLRRTNERLTCKFF